MIRTVEGAAEPEDSFFIGRQGQLVILQIPMPEGKPVHVKVPSAEARQIANSLLTAADMIESETT